MRCYGVRFPPALPFPTQPGELVRPVARGMIRLHRRRSVVIPGSIWPGNLLLFHFEQFRDSASNTPITVPAMAHRMALQGASGRHGTARRLGRSILARFDPHLIHRFRHGVVSILSPAHDSDVEVGRWRRQSSSALLSALPTDSHLPQRPSTTIPARTPQTRGPLSFYWSFPTPTRLSLRSRSSEACRSTGRVGIFHSHVERLIRSPPRRLLFLSAQAPRHFFVRADSISSRPRSVWWGPVIDVRCFGLCLGRYGGCWEGHVHGPLRSPYYGLRDMSGTG